MACKCHDIIRIRERQARYLASFGRYRVKVINQCHAGDQFESTKSNTPKLKFGTALREASEKIFISSDHEKSG